MQNSDASEDEQSSSSDKCLFDFFVPYSTGRSLCPSSGCGNHFYTDENEAWVMMVEDQFITRVCVSFVRIKAEPGVLICMRMKTKHG
ncbi:unnamed protein product [Calypogeia fissa]